MSPRVFNWRPAVSGLLRGLASRKPAPAWRPRYLDLLRASRPLEARRAARRFHLN